MRSSSSHHRNMSPRLLIELASSFNTWKSQVMKPERHLITLSRFHRSSNSVDWRPTARRSIQTHACFQTYVCVTCTCFQHTPTPMVTKDILSCREVNWYSPLPIQSPISMEDYEHSIQVDLLKSSYFEMEDHLLIGVPLIFSGRYVYVNSTLVIKN